MVAAAAVGAVGAIGAGVISANGARSAAKKAGQAQNAALDKSISAEREMYDQTRADLSPYTALGGRANSLYESILTGIPINQAASYQQGFNPNGTTIMPDGTQAPVNGAALGGAYGVAQGANGTPDYSAFFNSPDYQFALQQGNKMLDNSASYHGTANTPQQAKAIERYGQGLASTQYNNFMSRLSALGSQGQASAAGQAQAAQNTGSSIGSAYAQQGNNTANGIVQGYNAQLNQGAALGQGLGLINSSNMGNYYQGSALQSGINGAGQDIASLFSSSAMGPYQI